MMVDGEMIEIMPLFVYGGTLELTNWPRTGLNDTFLRGDCTYHKDWFVVKITYDRDGLFEGTDAITFRKKYINTD